MNKLLIAIASVALLASCSEKKPMTYENDTDFHEWINQQSIKNVPNAHSGSSVSVIDSVHEFSLGFSKTIENISNSKFKEVTFSYWIYVTSEKAKASTVFSVDFNGKNVDWHGLPVSIRELNKWVEVKETYKLPASAKPNNQLGMYVLNESKEEIMIDDLKMVFK